MAVKIRLRRIGAKKQPAYRLVVADSRCPRDGRFIEIVGHYNPLDEPSTVVIDSDRALYWLRHGAQPTDVVKKMLVKKGIWAVFTGQAIEIEPLLAAPQEEPAVAVEEVVTPVEEIVTPVEETITPVEETATPAEESSEAASVAAETVEDE